MKCEIFNAKCYTGATLEEVAFKIAREYIREFATTYNPNPTIASAAAEVCGDCGRFKSSHAEGDGCMATETILRCRGMNR